MQGMDGDNCPFEFNFDPATFKVGDTVSFRIPKDFQDFPFVGILVEVHDDFVIIQADPKDPTDLVRGTREARPIVAEYNPI
jgi:hypothetical protein